MNLALFASFHEIANQSQGIPNDMLLSFETGGDADGELHSTADVFSDAFDPSKACHVCQRGMSVSMTTLLYSIPYSIPYM